MKCRCTADKNFANMIWKTYRQSATPQGWYLVVQFQPNQTNGYPQVSYGGASSSDEGSVASSDGLFEEDLRVGGGPIWVLSTDTIYPDRDHNMEDALFRKTSNDQPFNKRIEKLL